MLEHIQSTIKTITEVAWHNRKYYPANGRIQPSRQSLTSSVDNLDSSMSTDRRSRPNSPTWTTWASMSSNSVLRHLRHQADNTSNHLELLDLENSGKQQDNSTSKRDGGQIFGSLPKGQRRTDTDSPIFGVSEKLPILDIQESATTVTSDAEKYPDICLLRRKTSGKRDKSEPGDFVKKPTSPVLEKACSELRYHQLRCSSKKRRPRYEVKSDCSSSIDEDVTWKKRDLGKLKFNARDFASSDSCSISSEGSFEHTNQRLPRGNLGSKTRFIPGASDERARGTRAHSQENGQTEDDADYHIANNEADKSSKSRLTFNKSREGEEVVTHIFIDHYDIQHRLAAETKCPVTSGERSSQNNADSMERSQKNFNVDGMHSGARDDQCVVRHDDKAKQASQSTFCGSAFRTALSWYDARQKQKQSSSSNASGDSDHSERRKSVAPRLKGLVDKKSGIRMVPLHAAKKQPLVSADEKMAPVVSNCKLEPGETVENDVEKCVSRNSSCMTPDSLLLRSQSSNTTTSPVSQPLHRTAVNNQVRNCIRALISAESLRAHSKKEPSFYNCAESDASSTIKNDEDSSAVNTEHDASKQKDNKLSFLAYLMDDGYLAQLGRETISKSNPSVANDAAAIEKVHSSKESRTCNRTSSVSESRKALKKTKYKKAERRLRGILSVEKITPTEKRQGKPKTADTENIHKSETGFERLRKDCDNLIGLTICEGQGRRREAGPSIPCADFLNPAESGSSHNVTVIAFDVPDVTDFAREASNHQADSQGSFFDNGTNVDIFNSFSASRVKLGEQNSTSETMFGVNSFDSSTVSNSVSDSTSSNEEPATGSKNKHSFGALGLFAAKNTRRAKRNTQKAATSSGRAGISTKDHIGAYPVSTAYSRALIQSAFASNMFSRNTFGYSSYKAPANISCILPDSSSTIPAVEEVRNLKDAFNVCSGMLLSTPKMVSDHGFEATPPNKPCQNQSVITPVTFSSYLEELNTDTPTPTIIPQFARDESGARCTPRKKDTHYVCTPSPRPLLTISASNHVSPVCQSFRSKRFPKRPYYFSVHSKLSKARHQNEKVDLTRSTLSDDGNKTMSTATDECQFGQMRDKFQPGCTMVRPRSGRFKWKPLTRPYGSVCSRRRTFFTERNRPSLAEQALMANSLYREYACYGGDLPRKTASTKGLASHRLFPSGSIWRKSRLKHFPSCPIGLQARRKMNGYKKCLKNAHETEHLKKCEPQQGRVQGCKGGPPTDNRQVKVAQARSESAGKKTRRNPIYENSLKRCKKRLAEMRSANKDPKNIPLPSENNVTPAAKTPKPGKSVGFAGPPKLTGKPGERKCLQPVQKTDCKSPRTQSEGTVKSKGLDVFSRLYPNSTPGRCIRNTRSVCSELVQSLKTDSSRPGSFVREDVQRLWRMDKDIERVEASSKGVVAATSLETSDKNTVKRFVQGKDGAAPGVKEDISSHRRMIECIKLVLKKQSEALDAINDSLNILERRPDADSGAQDTGESGKCPQNAPDVSNCNKETGDTTTMPTSGITFSTSGLMKTVTSKGLLTKDHNTTKWVARKQSVMIESIDKLPAVSSPTNQGGVMTQTLLLPPRRLAPLPQTPRSSNVHPSLPRLSAKQQCNIEPCLLGDIKFQGRLTSQFSISSNVSSSIPPLTAAIGTLSSHENEKLPVDDIRSELTGAQFYPSPYTLSCKGSCDKNTLERTNHYSRPNSCRPKQKDAQTDSETQPQQKLQSSHTSDGDFLRSRNCGNLRSSKSSLDHKYNQRGNVTLPVLSNPHQNNNSSLQKPKTCQTCVTTASEQGVLGKHQDSEHACTAVCPCLELCLKKFVTPYLDENLGPQSKGSVGDTKQADALNEIQTQIQNLVNSIHSHSKCSYSQVQKNNQAVGPRYQPPKEEAQCSGTVNARLLSAPDDHCMTSGSSSGYLCCHPKNEPVTMNNQSQASKTFTMNAGQSSGVSVTTESARQIELELELHREVSTTNEGCTAETNQDVYSAQRLEMEDADAEQPSTSTACGESGVLEQNQTTRWIQSEDDNHSFGERSQAMVAQSFQYSHSFENRDSHGDISTSELLLGTVQSASISTCHSNDRSVEATCDRSQQGSLGFYQSQSVESFRNGGDNFGPGERNEGKTCEIISHEPSFTNPSQTPPARNADFPPPSLATETDRTKKSGLKEDLNTVTTKPPPVQKQRFVIRSWFPKPGSLIKNLKRPANKAQKPEITKDNSPKEPQSFGKSAKRFGRSMLGSPNKSQAKPCSTTATVENTNAAPMHPKQRHKAAVSSSQDTNKKNSTHQNKANGKDKNNSNFLSKYPADQSVNNLTVAPMTSEISTNSQAQSPTISFSVMIPMHTRRILLDDEVGDKSKALMHEVEFQSPTSTTGYKESRDVEGSRDNSENWQCANAEERIIENTAHAADELKAMEIMIQQNNNPQDGVPPITDTTLEGFKKQMNEKHGDCLIDRTAGGDDVTRGEPVAIPATQRSSLNEQTERLPDEECSSTRNSTAELTKAKVLHSPTTSRNTSQRGETPLDQGSCQRRGDNLVHEGPTGEDSASKEDGQAGESSSGSNPKAPLMVCKVNPFVNNALAKSNHGSL